MSQQTICPRCGRHVAPRSRRCFSCGARIYFAEPETMGPEAPAEPGRAPESRPRSCVEEALTRPERGRELTEIQRRILLASWRESRGPIYVCAPDRASEGEVKSGAERFFGDEAVVALAGLVPPGLIVDVGDDCFALTDDGARMALRLACHG